MPRLMPRRAAGLLALSLSALAGAGCGGAHTTAASDRTIDVTLDEYRIVPQRISAPAGTLRVVARNTGLLTHNLVIETIPKNPDNPPRRLRQLRTLHAGERTARSVTLRPGTYRLVCSIANHETLGQYGTLIVR
ncbi:MAG TPA: cupredoxin domain-containing protein [Solirubrobacteraceae bacterium]|nr:cupredoxin domain-containing protein [Solirubrobacteraceae bacterium]